MSKNESRLTYYQKEAWEEHDKGGNDRGIVHIRQLLAIFRNIWNFLAQLVGNTVRVPLVGIFSPEQGAIIPFSYFPHPLFFSVATFSI